jgi:hypothetical protein
VRIHGIHLRGIRTPRGEHRIACDPGYNVVVASSESEAAALVRLIELLLYPRDDPAAFAPWNDPGGPSGRAELSFSFGNESYRTIYDFERSRFVLARHPEGAAVQRVSSDPVEICLLLREAGLPSLEDFAILHLPDACSGDASEQTLASDGTRAPELMPQQPPPAPDADPELPPDDGDPLLERARIEGRLRILRRARERYLSLEREQKQIAAELERQAVLAELLFDLDAQLDRYRDSSAARAQELASVEAARRALRRERGRLKAVPSAQRSLVGLGLGLGAVSGLAAALLDPLFYALSGVGVGAALLGLFIARGADRGLGQADARLAALRLRESSVERRFESQTGQVRELLQTLELSSVDELQREVADYRALSGREEAVRRELAEARSGYPEEAEAELRQLELQLAQLEGATQEVPTLVQEEQRAAKDAQAEASQLVSDDESDAPTQPSVPPLPVEALLRAAELVSGRPESEIRQRMAPMLAIYLRALTGGEYTRAWFHGGEGWYLRREGQAERVRLNDLGDGARAVVVLAFRLALLESLVPGLRLPLVLHGRLLAGPDAAGLDRVTAARALRRLGGAVQVIQCTSEAEPWSEAAHSVYRLSS